MGVGTGGVDDSEHGGDHDVGLSFGGALDKVPASQRGQVNAVGGKRSQLVLHRHPELSCGMPDRWW